MKNFKTLSTVDLKNISGGKGTSIWGAFGKIGTAAVKMLGTPQKKIINVGDNFWRD